MFSLQYSYASVIVDYTYSGMSSQSNCSGGELSTGGSTLSGRVSSLFSWAVPKPLKPISSSSKLGVDSLYDMFKVALSPSITDCSGFKT